MGLPDFYEPDTAPERKFFISYRRSAENDRFLANYLRTRLKQAGHQVFIDADLRVGMEWAAEINWRILDWCDYVVVLLSEHSVTSEMVKGEVRKAHQAKRSDGHPTILPVRVAYDEELNFDYELDSYLSPLQYLYWNGEDDPRHVLDDLIDAVNPYAEQEPPAAPFVQDPIEQALERSNTVADRHALLRAPGCACKIGDPLYIDRQSDAIVEELSAGVGETIVIKAARQMGKSSLLVRYLESCRDTGKQIVYIDFQSFTNADLDLYECLLRRVAAHILRSLRLDGPDVATISSQQDFIYFIEDHVLNAINEPITFGFDEVDRLLCHPYKTDFFSMLRTWHNNSADPLSRWADVDMALVIATEPHLLIKSGDRSPFNVGVPIELRSFARTALDRLNGLYGSPLHAEQLNQLQGLLAGHPYLTRLAFYRLVGRGMTFAELIRRAEYSDGPFGDHLRAMLLFLQQQPELFDNFKKLIRDPRWQPDEVTYYRLRSAGLTCRHDGRIEPANQLYADFFAQVQ